MISKDGILKDADIRAGILEQGDCISADNDGGGITKDEFFKVLDKASQPKESGGNCNEQAQ